MIHGSVGPDKTGACLAGNQPMILFDFHLPWAFHLTTIRHVNPAARSQTRTCPRARLRFRGAGEPAMAVLMELSRIFIREMTDMQIIELTEVDGDRTFPIVIGL